MNKRILSFANVSILCLLLITSCAPRNPPLNSVVTAHGNTDWHIDTAEEFLYGTEMSGATTAPNHVPDTWTKRHMQIGLTNTHDFYYDEDLIATGADTDATNGIETAMLFFYAGHGWPESWDTLGNSATQSNMSLGDYLDGGLLRYYWQCSCEVFAHGPYTCTGSSLEYSCPGDFDGSADSFNHRNVYGRWGPVLNADLRMACGASTLAYCHENQTNRIWDNYNNSGFDVADSFIDGLNWWGVVPLCITLGGSNVTNTPLYDLTFTNQPNTSGKTYYHIQYLTSFASNPTGPIFHIEIPRLFPIFKVKPLPEPDPIKGIEWKKVDGWLVSPDTVEGRGARVRVNPISGSVYVQGPRLLDVQKSPLEEAEYIEIAKRYLRELGWIDNKTFSEPIGFSMMLSSQPVENTRQAAITAQKNVIVTFKRTIDVNGLPVNVLGEGGVMRIQMNNDGSLLNANIVWREIEEVKGEVPLKTYDEALAEATAQLDNPGAYQLDQWNWGLKEESGNVKQTELHVVFQFTFVSKDPKLLLTQPPRMVEIAGEKQ